MENPSFRLPGLVYLLLYWYRARFRRDAAMEFRRLGQSDLQFPVVSFGAWAAGGWMWGGTTDEEVVRAIRAGIDYGITCIDTAPVYGMGHSETIVGKAIEGRRNEVVIATKCGLRWDLDEGQFYFETQMNDGTPCTVYRNLKPRSILYECEQSLRRLGIDAIDLYQCHWPDVGTPLEATVGALNELRQQGKIRAFGVSNFSVDQLAECMEHGPLASDQPKYNPLEREIETDVLPFCIENDIGVLAYSPIAQGLMTGKVTMDRVFPEGDQRRNKPWFKPENRRQVLDMLAKLEPIAEDHGATLAQVAINWVISQKGITSALVGARNEKQVAENARAADLKLADDEIAAIRHAVEALTLSA